MFGTTIIFSALFMYLLASSFWGKMGGALSAIFYAYAPYHAVDLYVRGAMGELWGIMFFPLIFWAIYNFIQSSQKKYLIYFILSVAGLVLSHNLLAMLFVPLLVIFSTFLLWQLKKWELTKTMIFGLILALGLSAFFWIPAILEKQYAHIETMIMGYFGYTEHFKGLYKLFVDRSWGWGASIREIPGGEKDGMSYQVGILHVLLFLVSSIAAVKFWRKQRLVNLIVIFATLVFLGSVFMVNPRSIFIWDRVPILAYMQFPWRFLAFIIFVVSWISGAFFLVVKKGKLHILLWVILVGALLILNKDYFQPERYYPAKDSDFLSGANWDKEIKRSIFDYLPIFAKAPPRDLAEKRYEILAGQAQIQDWRQGTNWINFKINSLQKVRMRLSQYYFPGWKIYANDQEIPIKYDNFLGLMTIDVPEGNYQINARLYDTPIRSSANALSLVSFVIFGYIILRPLKLLSKRK